MRISYQTVGEVEVIRLHGGISAGDDHDLLNALLQQLRAGRKHLVLNLHDASAKDNSLIIALTSSYPMVKRQGGRLILVDLNPQHGESSEVAGLSTLFDVYDSEAEAIASFA